MTARAQFLLACGAFAPLVLFAFAALSLPREEMARFAFLAWVPWAMLALDSLDTLIRMLARWRKRRAPDAFTPHAPPAGARGWRQRVGIEPYAFVTLVRNLGADVDAFIARRSLLREHTWIADLGSDDRTALRLGAAGWRCANYSHAADERAALAERVASLPPEISTVVLLEYEADLTTAIVEPERFRHALRDFQRSGAAALCPRVNHGRHTLVAMLMHEDASAAFGLESRTLDPLATLPANAVYRRDVLQRLLADPSTAGTASLYDDTLLVLARGERIHCDDRLDVRAPTPASFGAWLESSAMRWRETTRTYWTRRREIDRIWRRGPLAFYHYLWHAGLLPIVATPLRAVAAAVLLASFLAACLQIAGGTANGTFVSNPIADPELFALVYCAYALLHIFTAFVAAPRGERIASLACAPLGLIRIAARGLAPLAAPFVGRGKVRKVVSREVAHVAG